MAVSASWTVWCNSCGRTAEVGDPPTIGKARQRAAEIGWRRPKPSTQPDIDLCPECQGSPGSGI